MGRWRTEEERIEIRDDYLNGMALEDIMSKHKVTKTVVYKTLKKFGIESNRNMHDYHGNILKLIDNGYSFKAIIDELGCKPNTARTFIREKHLKVEPLSEKEEQEVVAAYKEDRPIQNILDEFYIGTTVFYKVLNKNGINLKNHNKNHNGRPKVRTKNEKVSKDGRTLDRNNMTKKLRAIDRKRKTYSEPVDCCYEVKKACYYGCLQDESCSYCLTEQHSRGCSARACTKFITPADAVAIAKGVKK